ncbi:MAG: hypothetical protein LBP42_03650 [Treponema sp.]|jgi:hypothetical protein|nr:hypothetical protein [Treponema sp.]
MKKILFLAVIATVLNAVVPVMAVDISDDKKSEYYYVSVPIERIYPYSKGYVVTYRKGISGLATVYLPIEWFSTAAGKGELISMGAGSTWPHLTVYYKSGQFSHVRLYVRRESRHEIWGNVPQNVNLDEHFENVDDIKLEF